MAKLDNSYSHDDTFSFDNFQKELTIATDSTKTKNGRSNKSNASKMTMNFLAVSREKNQKRAFFDWNNKPMLLINQTEIEPKVLNKDVGSHDSMPEKPVIRNE